MLCVGIALLFLTLTAQAATIEVYLVKYASDNTTILNDTTVTYEWMAANLPVQGDGVTHYYQQGPVFEGDGWDPDETKNLKDKGAVKGTNVRNLCELVGNMSHGDEIKIIASDGFSKWFGYENVYSPQQGQGPMVLCWYQNGDQVSDYDEGMQLVFFANDTVFGNWDMHESLVSKYRYNYSDDYPSANGLSVKWISEIAIYSTVDPPELHSIKVSPGKATLDIGSEKRFTGAAYDQYASEMSDIVFTWASSDETVGKIDSGIFTALAAGKTVIMAKKGGVQGTASVTVSSPALVASPSPTPTPSQVLTTLTISPAAATLNVGEAQQFTGVAY
ncbi:MAG: Ig-like domain-containing protein, partial [Methanosarcinales archaeon]|nr:Ig-like domain-containing protein [Methanosarcinales archaeon]